ncbi:hypothetical protein MAR_033634, partial [Mya arenaria]
MVYIHFPANLTEEEEMLKLNDKKEKQGFKRSRNFEKKLQDPEKTPQPMVAFTPFAATQGEEREEREERPARPRGAQVRGLYDSFVKGDREPRPDREVGREEREERFRERRPVREREPLPKKAASTSQKGVFKDKRDVVAYEDD